MRAGMYQWIDDDGPEEPGPRYTVTVIRPCGSLRSYQAEACGCCPGWTVDDLLHEALKDEPVGTEALVGEERRRKVYGVATPCPCLSEDSTWYAAGWRAVPKPQVRP